MRLKLHRQSYQPSLESGTGTARFGAAHGGIRQPPHGGQGINPADESVGGALELETTVAAGTLRRWGRKTEYDLTISAPFDIIGVAMGRDC